MGGRDTECWMCMGGGKSLGWGDQQVWGDGTKLGVRRAARVTACRFGHPAEQSPARARPGASTVPWPWHTCRQRGAPSVGSPVPVQERFQRHHREPLELTVCSQHGVLSGTRNSSATAYAGHTLRIPHPAHPTLRTNHILHIPHPAQTTSCTLRTNHTPHVPHPAHPARTTSRIPHTLHTAPLAH